MEVSWPGCPVGTYIHVRTLILIWSQMSNIDRWQKKLNKNLSQGRFQKCKIWLGISVSSIVDMHSSCELDWSGTHCVIFLSPTWRLSDTPDWPEWTATPNIRNVTRKWTYGPGSQNEESIMEILRMFDLFAVNAAFQPKRSSSTTTFITSSAKSAEEEPEQFIDKQVLTRYYGWWIKGTVIDYNQTEPLKKWMVSFEDCYNLQCNKKNDSWTTWLQLLWNETESITKLKSKSTIFVSNRWCSSVIGSKVKWASSIHRNYGGKADHAMVMCTWSWRLRAALLSRNACGLVSSQPRIRHNFDNKRSLYSG